MSMYVEKILKVKYQTEISFILVINQLKHLVLTW